MGFVEVLMNLRTIFRTLKYCKEDIVAYQPDAIILIDYPGFNLRIAKWAKEQGFKVIYYISPQVWAWKEGRVKMMKQCIDKMLVILPFEKDYYRNKWNWEVEYVGHPLLEEIERRTGKVTGAENSIEPFSKKPIVLVAVLPDTYLINRFRIPALVYKPPEEPFLYCSLKCLPSGLRGPPARLI